MSIIRCVQSVDIITTIAGTGTSSYDGDGIAATSAALNLPGGVGLDSSGMNESSKSKVYMMLSSPFLFIGNVYIADGNNNRVRKVTVSTGIIFRE